MSLSVASNIQLALETYSTDETVYFYFSNFESKRNILNALSVPYLHGGTTNTAAALTTAGNSIFSTNFGDRPQNDDVLLLLTDGWSDRPRRTWEEAMKLREKGVHIIVVGIGNAVNDGELKGKNVNCEYMNMPSKNVVCKKSILYTTHSIRLNVLFLPGLGSYPIEDNVIQVNTFDELYTIQDQVRELICNSKNLYKNIFLLCIIDINSLCFRTCTLILLLFCIVNVHDITLTFSNGRSLNRSQSVN